jgi:hypothetical protein
MTLTGHSPDRRILSAPARCVVVVELTRRTKSVVRTDEKRRPLIETRIRPASRTLHRVTAASDADGVIPSFRV